MEKRLCKSNTDKVFAGVCGGIAEFFNINSLIVRLIFVFTSGGTFIIYLILALFLPYGNNFDEFYN
jgi:phage shock protein C